MSSRKKSPNPSVSSDERKTKHGSTAPHGVTGRGKTHIGGKSLGTYSQGSTSPPATGQRSSGFQRPTPGHRPIAQRTRRHIWPTGHRPPGMPGHRALATGHSPTTGQMREEETSSLPITGHRPPSHRSLESDRLNPMEIQESQATEHDRSPGSRPPVTGHPNIIQNIASDSQIFGSEFTSKQPSISRVLLPLEPDFSNMSDPSVVIEPPSNNWRPDNNNDNYR